MIIDLVHTQPLFREDVDTLVVKYTHPETGVHIEIPYDDLVNTVVAVSAILGADDEPEEAQDAPVDMAEQIEEQVLAGAPSGLRVMRSHVALDDI